MALDREPLRIVVAQGGLDECGRGELRGRERPAVEQLLRLIAELEVEEADDEAQIRTRLARGQGEMEVDDVTLVAEHERLGVGSL